MSDFFAHESAYIDEGVSVGSGTKIWHFTHLQSGARIGRNCVFGQNVFVGKDVKIGDYVKIQNNVSVYEGVELENYVFCGPSMVFTNDINPRSEFPKGRENFKKTLVKTGATIGANATVLCGYTVGAYALISAGAVVTADVPDHALMIGVPAKRKGWICRCGNRLDTGLVCKACGRAYEELERGLTEI